MADVHLCRTSLYLGSPSPSPSSSWSSCSSLLSTPWLQSFKVERVSVSYSLHSDTTSGKSFWEPNRELITHNMQIGKYVFFLFWWSKITKVWHNIPKMWNPDFSIVPKHPNKPQLLWSQYLLSHWQNEVCCPIKALGYSPNLFHQI